MKYAAYDLQTGQIIGFYTPEINPYIPESSIEITDEQWQEILNNQSKWIVDTVTKQLVLTAQ